jgi:GAF domain
VGITQERLTDRFDVGAISKRDVADDRRVTRIRVGRRISGSVVGRVAVEDRTVQIFDAQADADWRAINEQAPGIGRVRTLRGVPMRRESVLIGAIAMWRTEARAFTAKELALVETFADQAVIAIENSRLLNELRQRTDDLSEALEQQTATSEVLQVISGSPGELEPVFQAMLANATRLCEAKFGAMYLSEGSASEGSASEGSAFRIVAMHNVAAAFAEMRCSRACERRSWIGTEHGVAAPETDGSNCGRASPAVYEERNRLGVIVARTGRGGFEVYAADDHCLGLFPTPREAAAAITMTRPWVARMTAEYSPEPSQPAHLQSGGAGVFG